MTAGHGVSHIEEATGRYRGRLEGIQLWVGGGGQCYEGWLLSWKSSGRAG